MNEKLRAALVIARRDYIATVWSKTFLLFLIGPLLPIGFGIMFGQMGANLSRDATPPTIAVIAAKPVATSIGQARERISAALPGVPLVRDYAAKRDQATQVKELLKRPGVVAVLSDLPDHPALTGPEQAIYQFGPAMALVLSDARRAIALESAHAMPMGIAISPHPVASAAAVDLSGRQSTARGGQLILVILTMILAGMLLSNLTEEKSNKVIEVLAAAVPIDAIFFGKLIAMLGMSLTGIAIWGSFTLLGVAHFAPGALVNLAVPSVGWPLFIGLGVIYFIASYLLLGALFLGIGAQASTVREVQVLSMPITMGQLGVFGLASAAIEHPDGTTAMIATIFPWSSPFAMMARAAQLPELWPHLLAMGWQMLWVILIIRLGARFFRSSVLKSGGPKRRRFGTKAKSSRP